MCAFQPRPDTCVTLHLIKLCVGCDTVDELLAWRESLRVSGQPWILRTRQTPKRGAELTDDGSLYRVYKGFILSRQRILRVDTIGAGPEKRCEMVLAETITLTQPTPRRPFQGWRYLRIEDAPPDIDDLTGQSNMPAALALRLREIGAW